MTTIPNRLDLPLFLISRIPIRKNRIEQLKSYIASKALEYTEKCIDDSAKISYQHAKLLHLIGVYPKTSDTACITLVKRTEKRFRGTSSDVPAPNLYDVRKEPYQKWKGQLGACWERRELRKSKTIQNENSKFYPTTSAIDRWKLSCNAHRGRFLSDPRQRKPCSRLSMVSQSYCYRNPNDPGPGHYTVNSHEISQNVPETMTPLPEKPYKFYRRTTCRVVDRYDFSNATKDIIAAPGRYETRYGKVLCRTARLVYRPYLYLDIDKQKRQKFRRLKWMSIKRKLYCDPNMEHVKGGGFTRLFHMTRKEKLKLKEIFAAEKIKAKRSNKYDSKRTPVHYADAHYLHVINNTPHRIDDRMFIYPREPKIRFNSIIKPKVKKKAKQPKEVGFLCGARRFDDLVRPPSLTKLQVRNIINSLPERLRLVNKPVMAKQINEIQPRLYEQKGERLKIRRRAPISLPPLPPTKYLFQEQDVHVELEKATRRYPPPTLEQFFKKDSKSL